MVVQHVCQCVACTIGKKSSASQVNDLSFEVNVSAEAVSIRYFASSNKCLDDVTRSTDYEKALKWMTMINDRKTTSHDSVQKKVSKARWF